MSFETGTNVSSRREIQIHGTEGRDTVLTHSYLTYIQTADVQIAIDVQAEMLINSERFLFRNELVSLRFQ